MPVICLAVDILIHDIFVNMSVFLLSYYYLFMIISFHSNTVSFVGYPARKTI